MKHKQNETDALFLKAGEGRVYNCGSITAVFKADENETANKYSVSEWWLEPNSDGPGPHQHEDNDEVFYGIEGVASVLVGDKWVDVGGRQMGGCRKRNIFKNTFKNHS